MAHRTTALVVVLLVAVWAVAAPPAEAGHSKKDDTTEHPAEDPDHHKPFELRHFHHHHRHYHHYRDRSKHWVAGLLLALVCVVLGSCAAVGLWRRLCARRHAHSQAQAHAHFQLLGPAACPPFGRRVAAVAVDAAPLLQPPPPLGDAHAKEAPPPYKETWA